MTLDKARRWLRRLPWYLRDRKRCDHCGGRARWNEAWTSAGGDKVWHDACRSYIVWRRKAEERLEILDLVTDVWGVTQGDVTTLAEGRASTGANHRTTEESDAWNLAWRVMYDLKHRREATAKQLA